MSYKILIQKSMIILKCSCQMDFQFLFSPPPPPSQKTLQGLIALQGRVFKSFQRVNDKQ